MSGKSTRILVVCSMKSGSTHAAKVLSLYFGIGRVYPQDYWGNREQNIIPAQIEEFLDRPFVTQMHVRPHVSNIDAIRRYGLAVVYIWRNLGDVIVSFDDHIRLDDHRNPVCYVDDRDRYLALPQQHRYRYLIQHGISWYIAFYLSWRRALPEIGAIQTSYERMVAQPQAFFARIIQDLGREVEAERLSSILGLKHTDTRLNRGVVGRSVELLSKENKGLLEDLLLGHPEDLSELWLELPWRGRTDAAVACTLCVSLLADLARCPYNRGAGVVIPAPPYLRIEITAEDFFFVIPAEILAAQEGTSARLKLIVRGQIGSVFSLFWHGEGEAFSEARVIHVPYDGRRGSSTVEFPLGTVRGNPTSFRLDCFNAIQGPGIGEILEFVRIP
ncbi:MAG: hypothetical protein WBL61_21460 [Bryobacteraceae bacterium]